LRRFGQRFIRRIFTPAEIAFCRLRPHELAVRFAAKEAISKALGTGIWSSNGVWWTEMEILPDDCGKPIVHLSGRALQRSSDLGLHEIAISLSHSDNYAVAFVVAM
jgi:holo-[acyl-carrier protein] synthase